MIDAKIKIYRNTVILLAVLIITVIFLFQFISIFNNGANGANADANGTASAGDAVDSGNAQAGSALRITEDTEAALRYDEITEEPAGIEADLFFSDKMAPADDDLSGSDGILSDESVRLLSAAGYDAELFGLTGRLSVQTPESAAAGTAGGGAGLVSGQAPAAEDKNPDAAQPAADSEELTYIKQFAARTATQPNGPVSMLNTAVVIGARNGDIVVSPFAASVAGALLNADILLHENEDALLRSVATFDDTPKKPVYLTFDDGPSSLTQDVLEILKKRGVRATFFVIGRNVGQYPDTIRQMYADGHCIANHSYTHNYTALYKSASSLRSELQRCEAAVNNVLGFEYSPRVFRFPGGSTYKLAEKYKGEVRALGYKYYDWNCLNGDAQPQITDKSSDGLYNYMVETFKGQNEIIVLMHDSASKQTTVDMLERAIDFFRGNGYEFKTLNEK